MHVSDSLQTNEEIFGEKFYINMASVSNFVTELLLSENFVESMPLREINPMLLSDWFLKIIAIIFVAVLALGTFLFFKFKGKKQEPQAVAKKEVEAVQNSKKK